MTEHCVLGSIAVAGISALISYAVSFTVVKLSACRCSPICRCACAVQLPESSDSDEASDENAVSSDEEEENEKED